MILGYLNDQLVDDVHGRKKGNNRNDVKGT
jgi:hypothetical protein